AAEVGGVCGTCGPGPRGDWRKGLDAYLKTAENDKWALWLKARVLLAQGDRKAGRAMLKSAADGEDGVLVAMIDQADVMVDDGQLEGANATYDNALKKAKDHPLARSGTSLCRAESRGDVS